MNYKDIRSKSSLPYADISVSGNSTTRNTKMGFYQPYELITTRQTNDVSPNKTPRNKFGKTKDEKTYIEIKKERERLFTKANSPEKGFSNKVSNKNLPDPGGALSKFGQSYTNTAKKLGHQKNEGSQKSLQKSETAQSQNDTVKLYLKKLFEYYCQYGERMNVNSLKSHKYQKFASDACILDSKFNKSKLEVIFSSEGKSNRVKSQMDFETFLNSLIKIGEIKFFSAKNEDQNKIKSNNVLQMLLKHHIWPLYERVFGTPVILNFASKNQIIDKELAKGILDGSKQITMDENSTIHLPFGCDILSQMGTNMKKEEIQEITTNLELSDIKGSRSRRSLTPEYSNINTLSNISNITDGRRNTFNIVNSLVNIDNLIVHSQLEDILKASAPVIYEIYKAYFPWEISLSDDESFLRENSAKGYFSILKEFDLCPTLISKSDGFHIYQSETSTMPNNQIELNEFFLKIIKNIEVNPLGRTNSKGIIGKFFTFIRFLKVLCKIADLGFGKNDYSNSAAGKENSNKKLTEIEKICLLFEKMEMSDGFTQLEKKTNKTHSRKTSYILPKEMLDSVKDVINAKMNNDNFMIYDMENLNDAKNAELIQKNNRKTKLRKSVLGNFKDLFEHTNHLLEKYGNQLNAIFKYYCSFGDPLNTTQMKINKFSKFLREAGLIKSNSSNNSLLNSSSLLNVSVSQIFGIKLTDIDVIFFKLSAVSNQTANNINTQSNGSDIFNITRGSFNLNQSQISVISLSSNSPTSFAKRGSVINANAKIDFTGFVNSIELISLQIFPDRNEIEAIDYIMTSNIIPLIEKFAGKSNEQYQVIIKEKKENPKFVKALACLKKVIVPVFKFYQKNGVLNFDSFLKFATDFTIFPDTVSKSKLNLFFKTTMNNEFIFTDNGENETIDLDLFVEILALCAFEVPYRIPEPNGIEKIILFVEKLNQSSGPSKILKEYGHTRLPNGDNFDFITIFKNNFPVFFNLPENKKVGFFDVLNEEDEYS